MRGPNPISYGIDSITLQALDCGVPVRYDRSLGRKFKSALRKDGLDQVEPLRNTAARLLDSLRYKTHRHRLLSFEPWLIYASF